MTTIPVTPETSLAAAPAPTPAIQPTPTTTAPTPTPADEPKAPTPPSTVTEPQATPAAKPEPGTTPTTKTEAATSEPTPAPNTEPTPTTKESAPATTAAAVPLPTSPPATEPTSTSASVPAATTAAPASPTTEVEEPQNPLTKQFTDPEWKALKELRSKIPSILKDAYSDSPSPESKTTTPLILWGVPIDPTGKPTDARASVILMKFLRARNLNPSAAAEMLIATIRWRDEFGVEKLLSEEGEVSPEEVFGGLGYVYGKDRGGRPVTYNLYGANQDLKAVFGDVQRFIRWRVKLMEESIKLLDFVNVDQMVQVHDYEGVSMRNRDANSKNAASETTSTFQSHYPEFLYKKYFINVPSLLSWIFWLFKSLVSAQTFAKMSVVGGGTHAIRKALEEVIDDKEIPRRYGGGAEGF